MSNTANAQAIKKFKFISDTILAKPGRIARQENNRRQRAIHASNSPPAFITPQPDGITLAIKLQPRATKNELSDVLGTELRVKVTAPPVDAATNEALLRLLSDSFGLSTRQGGVDRRPDLAPQVSEMYGVTASEALTRLSARLAACRLK